MTGDLKERLDSARLYLVTRPIEEARLDAALSGGVDLVQLAHPKEASDQEIIALARRHQVIAAKHNVPLLLNGRFDLVEACNADGVHLNADDGAVAQARSVLGNDRLVGLWARNEAQVNAAKSLPVDYLSVGPINLTPTLADMPSAGTALAEYAAAASDVPVFAIGGIDANNVHQILAAGVTRIAVLNAIAESADPEQTASELSAALG